jgi:hypothetical protein
MNKDEEEFELVDETKLKKMVLFESPAIAELRSEIKNLKWELKKIGYMQTIGRVAYVLLNPNEMVKNLAKDCLYRITHSAVYTFILT